MTENFHFEELDAETREYLALARERQGKGVPGIFASKPFYLPLIGLFAGFGIMVLTLLLTFPPTGAPAKEALLQTAGFLLGGWLVVAALRIWASGRTGKYAGHFVYVDPENLYVGKGGVVEVTDLYELRDAKAVQNHNDGKYQHTDITLKIGKGRKHIQVHDEERGRRMTVYLNAVVYMRDGGEDGADKDLQKLSPEAMGAEAKKVAKTGEFSRRVGEADAGEVRVPRPKKDGRRSTGFLAMLVTIAVGGLMFLGFRALNSPLGDHSVFDQIKALPAREQPPALRQYLMNPAFKSHRNEAQQLLDTHYDNGVRTNVKGGDEALRTGLSEVVLSLKQKPQPVVTLITAEEQAPPGQEAASAGREKSVQTLLADKWGATIGDELVVFAAPADPNNANAVDKKAKGMVDLRWRYREDGSLEYTIEFRKSPDEAAFASKTATVPANMNLDPLLRPEQTIKTLGEQIIQMSVGMTRMRPMPPPGDF